MITVDLKERPVTVEELLSMASSDSLLIVARNGHEYTLEEADDLEREARMLGQSEKFMDFLERRRQEPGSIPLEAIEEALQSSPGDEAQ